MADIPNRDELERILARKLGGLNRRQMGELLELLGDPPDISKVPMSFWDDAGKELAQVVTPFSERVYLEAAERMLESVPVGVDWSLVNQAASGWARDYAFNLVSGINTTTQRAVGQAVGNFFEQEWTMGDLTRRLGRIYSPVRAEMIAITEVTRAAAEGERATVREIEKEGIRMVEVWQTKNDELVCPICGPRHGKKVGTTWSRNDGPPAHPRCRCWINHEFEKPREGQVEEEQVEEEKQPTEPLPEGVYENYKDLPKTGADEVYFITPDEKLVLVRDTHEDLLWGMSPERQQEVFGFIRPGGENPTRYTLRQGAVRVRETSRAVVIQTGDVNKKTLRKLQRLVDEDKLGLKPKKNIVWGNDWGDIVINTDYVELMNGKNIVGNGIKSIIDKEMMNKDTNA